MRSDYKVLNWRAHGPLDDRALVREYRARDFNGLFLRAPKNRRLGGLGFLSSLQGLQYLEIEARVADDSVAFEVPGLRELVLLTRGRRGIPSVENATLETLAVDDRSGEIDLGGLTALTRLTVWSSRRENLGFLARSPGISSFKFEGVGQLLDLRGLESCSGIKELEVLEARVRSLAPLRELQCLRRCWLIGGGMSIQQTGSSQLTV